MSPLKCGMLFCRGTCPFRFGCSLLLQTILARVRCYVNVTQVTLSCAESAAQDSTRTKRLICYILLHFNMLLSMILLLMSVLTCKGCRSTACHQHVITSFQCALQALTDLAEGAISSPLMILTLTSTCMRVTDVYCHQNTICAQTHHLVLLVPRALGIWTQMRAWHRLLRM